MTWSCEKKQTFLIFYLIWENTAHAPRIKCSPTAPIVPWINKLKCGTFFGLLDQTACTQYSMWLCCSHSLFVSTWQVDNLNINNFWGIIFIDINIRPIWQDIFSSENYPVWLYYLYRPSRYAALPYAMKGLVRSDRKTTGLTLTTGVD